MGKIPFFDYGVFEFPTSYLPHAERFLINKFMPKFNQDCLTKKIRELHND